VDARAYLDRISYSGAVEPTLANLIAIHRAHLLSVPFENLDIPQRPIVLDLERLYDKIVLRRRGGFCYECNGLFAWLLRTLGFQLAMLSGRAVSKEGKMPPEFDHLLLQVDLGEAYIADVGFGNSFLEPLRLVEDEEKLTAGSVYRLHRNGPRWELQRKENDGWKLLHDFTLNPHQLHEFAEMCRFHQTSPESPFTRGKMCSLATPTGRVTVSDLRLIITENGRREERQLASEEEWRRELQQRFGVVL